MFNEIHLQTDKRTKSHNSIFHRLAIIVVVESIEDHVRARLFRAGGVA